MDQQDQIRPKRISILKRQSTFDKTMEERRQETQKQQQQIQSNNSDEEHHVHIDGNVKVFTIKEVQEDEIRAKSNSEIHKPKQGNSLSEAELIKLALRFRDLFNLENLKFGMMRISDCYNQKYLKMNSDYHFLFKVLLIGNSGVGKSCMLMRYSENQFTNNFYNTIGVDFKTKTLQIGEHNVKLQIWDTAGQDRFRTITCSYYRGAQGIMIVYDITDRDSFENVKTWMAEIDKYASESVNRMLIGNKSDMAERREVSYEEGLELSRQYQIPFYETSAKSSINIETAFTHITKNIHNKELHNNRAVIRKPNNLRLQNRQTQSQSQKEKKKQEDLCC